MLCPQHMLCEMVSFSTSKPSWNIQSHRKSYPEGPHSFIPSSDFFVCWCWSGSAVFSTPTNPPYTHTHTIKGRKKKKKGWKGQVTGWPLIHDSALKISALSNQIVQLEGAEGPQSCPGPLNVTSQLRGVNMHFSQLSRTCDGVKGKQRSTEFIIESLKYWLGWWKKFKWLKWLNAQITTHAIKHWSAFVEAHQDLSIF